MVNQMLRTRRDASGRGLFLKKFWRDGMRVASVVPSSRPLAAELCARVDGSRPQMIIDVGAGTGAVTEVALERMHPESRIVAIELDPQFAEILQVRCPRAVVVCCDVRDLGEQLDRLGVRHVDLMICGLALPCVPRASTSAMFDCLKHLGRDAWYTQLTLVPYVYKSMYHRLFEQVDFRLVLANFPPGGAYHCRTLRPDFADHVPGTV
jgi:phosphatidylethanolamine/phosphatidyl-N-methylethanolamine N-methyltransferase